MTPPPRTRGSTPDLLFGVVGVAASPAYAGIDLSGLKMRRPVACLPRVRGDRPGHRRRRIGGQQPPPRTRGSTRADAGADMPEVASPAYAGIDPRDTLRRRRARRLPRVRGDRPCRASDAHPLILPPPRTRGSTLDHLSLKQPRMASPAYAGIDPWLLLSVGL